MTVEHFQSHVLVYSQFSARTNTASLCAFIRLPDCSAGVQELDCLIDLDLTDNLLARHSDLQPLQNLHNLCLLSLIGEL